MNAVNHKFLLCNASLFIDIYTHEWLKATFGKGIHQLAFYEFKHEIRRVKSESAEIVNEVQTQIFVFQSNSAMSKLIIQIITWRAGY